MTITIEKKTNGSFEEIHNALSFVNLAINKHDVREFCNTIHYRDGIIIGTDGHRLHQVELDLNRTMTIQNSAYRIVKFNKRTIILEPEGCKIPDSAWNFTTPEKGASKIPEILPPANCENTIRHSTNVYRLIASLGVIRIDGRDYGYNYNYLADALSHGALEIYRNKGTTGLLIIKADYNYAAAVMPMCF